MRCKCGETCGLVHDGERWICGKCLVYERACLVEYLEQILSPEQMKELLDTFSRYAEARVRAEA